MTNRRNFLNMIAAAGSMALLPSFSKASEPAGKEKINPGPFKLNHRFTDPVILKNIELLRFDGQYILRVTDQNGISGATLCNQRIPNLVSLLHGLVIPNLVGKDARDIEALLDHVYVVNSNYKYAGMPFWNSVGHVEVAIFDLLGQIARKPVWQLLGKQVTNEIEVYISSTTRETTPEQEAASFVKRLAETGAKAVKFKVGGRMSKNADAMPGRSETIVPTMRKALGNDITFYVDANGSYDLENGIRMARYLEDHNVSIFEEPVPFDEYENTLKVAKSGGFQEWHIGKPNHKSWYAPHYEIKNGKIAVPNDPGLGITFDKTIWRKAEKI